VPSHPASNQVAVLRKSQRGSGAVAVPLDAEEGSISGSTLLLRQRIFYSIYREPKAGLPPTHILNQVGFDNPYLQYFADKRRRHQKLPYLIMYAFL
jgi:hypothetical protein